MSRYFTRPPDRSAAAGQRGATAVSVLLLLLALAVAAMLSVRLARRSLAEADAAVAEQRTRETAAGAIALAAARLRALGPPGLDAVLAGALPQGPNCADPCRDCRPQGVELTSAGSPAAGTCVQPPCIRPGAIARLPDQSGSASAWCRTPARQLVAGADANAIISVWVRNDRAEGLDPAIGWMHDENRRVVVTAVAELRGTRVVEHREVVLDR